MPVAMEWQVWVWFWKVVVLLGLVLINGVHFGLLERHERWVLSAHTVWHPLALDEQDFLAHHEQAHKESKATCHHTAQIVGCVTSLVTSRPRVWYSLV